MTVNSRDGRISNSNVIIRIFETFRMRLLRLLFENSNLAIANTSEADIRIFSNIASIFDFSCTVKDK